MTARVALPLLAALAVVACGSSSAARLPATPRPSATTAVGDDGSAAFIAAVATASDHFFESLSADTALQQCSSQPVRDVCTAMMESIGKYATAFSFDITPNGLGDTTRWPGGVPPSEAVKVRALDEALDTLAQDAAVSEADLQQGGDGDPQRVSVDIAAVRGATKAITGVG